MSNYNTAVITTYNALDAKMTAWQKEMFVSYPGCNERLQFAENLLEHHKLLPIIPMAIPKNDKESLEHKNQGTEYLTQNKPKEALESFNKCIAYAENDSELLSLGYAYRSRTFVELKLYNECLRDIKLAMKTPSHLPSDIQNELGERKQLCENEIKKSESQFSECQKDINDLVKLSYPKHPKVPFIANCLELIHTADAGRSIKTNCDLKVGDVIAIEQPFASALDVVFRYKCCTYCLKESVSLIPCPSCTSVMFCNQKCMKIAYQKFHKYECEMNFVLQTISTNQLLSIRVVLQAISIFKDINRLVEFENNKERDTNIFTIESDISDYYDINNGDDNDDTDKDYNLEMKEIYYHPMHGLVKDATAPKNLESIEYITWAVETILTTNQLSQILNRCIKTNVHKRFLRNFIYRQVEAATTYAHGLTYRGDLSPTSKAITYGSAMYTCGALFNHSCAPNIIRRCNGSTTYAVVIRPIQKDDEIFDSYGCYFWIAIKIERQMLLKNMYMFDCTCEACEHDFQLGENLGGGSIESFVDLTKISTENPNLKEVTEVIKRLFDYLNQYCADHYPCSEIFEADRQLRRYYSYFIKYFNNFK